MEDVSFTGSYMIDSTYNAIVLATGRYNDFKENDNIFVDEPEDNDISLKDILGNQAKVGIYLETPIQDVEVPYITIRQLDADKKRDNYRHFWRRALFDIEYIPDDTEGSKNIELLEVSEVLIAHLTDVKTPSGAKLHARSLKSEIVDSVLHIFADYQQLTVEPLPDDPTMMTLDHNTYIKDENERNDK